MQAVSQSMVEVRQEMSISVKSNLDAAVAKAHLDDFGMCPGADCESDGGVPQIVEAEVAYPHPRRCRLEVTPCPTPPQGAATRTGEHESINARVLGQVGCDGFYPSFPDDLPAAARRRMVPPLHPTSKVTA